MKLYSQYIVSNLYISKVVLHIENIHHFEKVVNEFIVNDLEKCDYDYYQHKVNLLCYLTDLYKNIKTKFDITKDDISIIDYINRMLNETRRQVYYYDHVIRKAS